MGYWNSLVCVVFVLLVFGQTCWTLENGAQYILGPGKKDCFYREFKQGTKIDFDAQVLNGGDLNVGFHFKTPSGKTLVEEHRTTEIDREMEAPETGTYEFCFDNTFSMFTEKVVYFDLGIEDSGDNNDQDLFGETQFGDLANTTLPVDVWDDSTQPELSKVVKSLKGLYRKMEEIIVLQAVHRAKEARHRKTAESNFRRVTWFSLFSCVLMILTGILQVVIIRNLFSERRGSKI